MRHSSLSISPLHACITALALAAVNGFGATSFVPVTGFESDPRGGAAEWDIFTASEGSQGTAPFTAGLNAPTSSGVSINVLAPITSPGGLIAGGDSYYSHSGAYGFSVNVEFAENVDFARISYALVGSQGAPDPFPISPDIAAATSLGSGSYSDANNNTVFYTDFELDSPETIITATFGDTPAPFSSFRSINGIRAEGLSAAPIPEPSSTLLLMLGLTTCIRRRRCAQS